MPLAIAVDSVIGSKELPGFLDAAAPASDDGRLLFAVALLFLVSLLQQIQQLTSSVLDTYTGEKLQLEFRRELFAHVQRLSLAYHDTRGTADATYRIQYDAPAIQWILVYGLTPFATSLLTLASMIYVTSRLDLQLALVALTIVPASWCSPRPRGTAALRLDDDEKSRELGALRSAGGADKPARGEGLRAGEARGREVRRAVDGGDARARSSDSGRGAFSGSASVPPPRPARRSSSFSASGTCRPEVLGCKLLRRPSVV